MTLLREKTTNQMSYIELTIIVLFSAYYILPKFGEQFSFYIALALGVIYVGYAAFNNPKITKYAVICFLLFVWISILYTFTTKGTTISAEADHHLLKRFLSKLHQLFFSFFPLLLLVQTLKKANQKQKDFLIFAIGILLLYVMILTMRETIINPDIMRQWYSDDETIKEKNIAGYYFVYLVPILVAIAVLSLLHCRQWIKKVAAAGVIVFLFAFLIAAQYTLAFLITIIGIILIILNSGTKRVYKTIVVSLLIIFMLFLPNVLQLLINNISSQQMKIRLTELYNFFSEGDSSGYNLHGRLTLYWKTFKAFLYSPIWGNYLVDGMSGHATMLTVLADIGLLGGIPFYWFYFFGNRLVGQLIQDSDKRFLILFIMLMLMGFTNPIEAAFPLSLTVWFFGPLLLKKLYEMGSNHEKNMEN